MYPFGLVHVQKMGAKYTKCQERLCVHTARDTYATPAGTAYASPFHGSLLCANLALMGIASVCYVVGSFFGPVRCDLSRTPLGPKAV